MNAHRSRMADFCRNAYLGIVVFFMYVPILMLGILSFNSGKSRAHFAGFSLKWYLALLSDEEIIGALRNTIIIALLSALAATLLGTMAAVALGAMKRHSRNVILGFTNIPMLNADIVTGISLMLCFIAFRISLGFQTILIAHISFNIPYVILSVLPKLNRASTVSFEAAQDLGAGPIYAFFKVVLPDLMPGILSGFLLAFTMSLDDFIITHFTRGAGIDTISTLVYSQVRRGINPSIYALSTIIFVLVFMILLLSNFAPKWLRGRNA